MTIAPYPNEEYNSSRKINIERMRKMLAAIITLLLAIIAYTLFSIRREKKIPSNNFTPFDNAINGTNTELKRTNPIHDTKHQTPYKEEVKYEEEHKK